MQQYWLHFCDYMFLVLPSVVRKHPGYFSETSHSLQQTLQFKLALGTHCPGNIPLFFPSKQVTMASNTFSSKNIKRSWFRFCLHWAEMDWSPAKYLYMICLTVSQQGLLWSQNQITSAHACAKHTPAAPRRGRVVAKRQSPYPSQSTHSSNKHMGLEKVVLYLQTVTILHIPKPVCE